MVGQGWILRKSSLKTLRKTVGKDSCCDHTKTFWNRSCDKNNYTTIEFVENYKHNGWFNHFAGRYPVVE